MSPQQSIAHYQILSKLGEGGMGAVYRATDTKLNRDVAIKVLPDSFADDPDRLARFTREAQVLASLNHPNIASIYGVEGAAIVMELIEGDDLRGPLPLDTALDYAGQIAAGLSAAHEKGIVHRDLKPANIKVTRDGTVKILDFGLAKASEGAAAASGANPTMSPTMSLAMTQAGVILGTAAYMSPEQARGKEVDRRADIWAFGVVFYEMLAGTNLFGGETVTDILASVVKERADLDPVPPQVRRLLRACLEKDPKQRLQSIGDWRLLIDDSPPPATAPTLSAKRFPAAWAALAGVSIAAALTLAFVHFREQPPAADTVRFHLNPPPQTSFSASAPNTGIALSPDGKYLALVATQNKGTSIWVQPLDSLAARELPGTENAGSPFWSPDGRSLAFFAPGKLKRIEISGGPPVSLCDLPGTGTGGSWNRDGVILFGTNNGPVYRTSAGGGAPTPLTTLDTARNESFHARPWFLPDGRHFLYNSRGTDSSIFLASLEGGTPKRLAPAREGSGYAPPAPGTSHGHLLYLRDGTLMAQPLDPKTYDLAGEPSLVAEKIGVAITNSFFTASANGTLAYLSLGTIGGTQLQWFDREGRQLGTLGPIGDWHELDLSRDGKSAVASRNVNSANSDLWLMDVVRGVPTRFTFADAPAHYPVWSPDGKSIVFASLHPEDHGHPSLYMKNASGEGTEQLLLRTSESMVPWHWSDDGKYLIVGFSAISSVGLNDLSVIPMEGDRKPQPFLTSPYDKRFARFSPNVPGAPRWVAYASMESGRYEVYVQSYPLGRGKFQVSDSGSQPQWRADGKELFYLTPDNRIMAVDVKLAPQFEHGSPKPLFVARPFGGALAAYPTYVPSPDGKRFLISSQVQEAGAAPLTVVLNWANGVRK